MLSNKLKLKGFVWFRLCRSLCDKKDVGSYESTVVNDKVENLKKHEAASNRLASLLEELNVESQNLYSEKKSSVVLNLARPVVKGRVSRKKKKETDVERQDESIEPALVSAVQYVAQDLGGDSKKTESELLLRLRLHAQETAQSKIGSTKIKDTLAGMKVSETSEEEKLNVNISQANEVQRPVEVITHVKEDVNIVESELLQKMRAHMRGESESKDDELEKYGSKISRLFMGVKIDRSKKFRQNIDESSFLDERQINGTVQGGVIADRKAAFKTYKTLPLRDSLSGPVDLFGGKPLNWFRTAEEVDSVNHPVLKTWDALLKHELNLMVAHPPANAYEELISWTEQGKLWEFPINNEQGLEEEAKIGFEEHIFLEPHLEGFPEKGPIRQFMELVTVGLSKNPYMTVKRKIEHIEWFRQYFKDKEAVLRETGAL